jgi:predicted acylesterase/phospholipase RssA
MIALHPSENAPIREPLGIVCRGGPVNGPFAAGALLGFKPVLAERGIRIARLYANSASAPAATMAAIGREDHCCSIWSRLQPHDIIDVTKSWWSQTKTIGRLVRSESVFPSTGLERIIRKNIPAAQLFGESATPVSVMTVDYHSGDHIVFSNTDPAFRNVIHEGILGSMALTPFLKLQVIWAGPKGLWPTRQTPEDIRVGLMDGGYCDNLMIEHACRDGMNTVLVIDINGLQVGPCESLSWQHWSLPLQRAFHALIATNDRRNLYGATRVNEEIAIRDQLQILEERATGTIKEELGRIIEQMDTGRLGLNEKHSIQVHLVSDTPSLIPFDFANFKPGDTEHLIGAGYRAAQRMLAELK